jgi:molybdenum cofactor cytidylyltransferase
MVYQNVGAVLTCAGLSTRMNQNKAFVNWNGLPLIEQQISLLINSGIYHLVVVIGFESERYNFIKDKYPSVTLIENKNYESGRSSSIKSGLSVLNTSVDNLLILGVDQPRTQKIVQAVIKEHISSESLISYPVYHNRGGHPIIFNKATFKDINDIDEESNGLRYVTQKYNEFINKIDLDEEIVLLDLNTESNYLEALDYFNNH